MAAVIEESVGDSSRNVLENLKRVARALLVAASVEKKGSNDAVCLHDLISERNKLRVEKIQVQAELHLRQGLSVDPLKEETFSSETLSKRVEELEEELLTVKLQHSQESQLHDCFHQHDCMVERLFPKDEDLSPVETSIQRKARQQSELVSELLHKSREVENLKKELSMVRKDRASAQCQCRELMARLDKLTTEDNSDAARSKELESSVDSKSQLLLHISKDQVTLLRHTLLSLITASGVDWSQNHELCELTQKLGDHTKWT